MRSEFPTFNLQQLISTARGIVEERTRQILSDEATEAFDAVIPPDAAEDVIVQALTGQPLEDAITEEQAEIHAPSEFDLGFASAVFGEIEGTEKQFDACLSAIADEVYNLGKTSEARSLQELLNNNGCGEYYELINLVLIHECLRSRFGWVEGMIDSKPDEEQEQQKLDAKINWTACWIDNFRGEYETYISLGKLGRKLQQQGHGFDLNEVRTTINGGKNSFLPLLKEQIANALEKIKE